MLCCGLLWFVAVLLMPFIATPDNKAHGANMGPMLATWTLLSGTLLA